MAVSGTSFDLEYAKTNKSYAYYCWNNYNNEGNSMNISAADYGTIVGAWKSEIDVWMHKASQDDNSYAIDVETETFQSRKQAGEEYAKDVSGSNGKADGGGTANVVAAGATAAATGYASAMIAFALSKQAVSKSHIVVDSTTAIVACAAAGVVATQTGVMVAKKYNKEQATALEKLTVEQQIAQDTLNATQEDMENAQNEILEKAEEATEANEDTNKQIAGTKSDFDMNKAAAERIKAKKDSGIALTSQEQAQLEKYASSMEDASNEINEVSGETSEFVGGAYEEMGYYQDIFDNAEGTVAEINGLTDFAKGFDEQTNKNAKQMKMALNLNQVSGYALATAGVTMLSKGVFAWDKAVCIASGIAVTAFGTTSALLSGKEAGKQEEYATKADTETEARRLSEDINNETMSKHGEHVELYNFAMDDVEDLEIDMPEDLEIPDYEGNPIPDAQEQPQQAQAATANNQQSSQAGAKNSTSTSNNSNNNNDDVADDNKKKQVKNKNV